MRTWIAIACALATACSGQDPQPEPSYLLFQLFTFSPSPDGKATPFDKAMLQKPLDEIIVQLGSARRTGTQRRLGFSIGPLALDHTDAEMRTQIDVAFDLAEQLDL